MIVWKCWRDYRWFFVAGLIWLLLFWAVLLSHGPTVENGPHFAAHGPDVLAVLLRAFADVQVLVFVLLAWGMGTRGVGRDIGGGAGTFLLTRPVRRGSFVWIEWLIGIALLAALVCCAGLCYWAAVHFHLLRVTYIQAWPNHHLTWVNAALSAGTVAVSSLASLLFLALVFSLAHCGTTIFRHSTSGLLFCLGAIVVYWFLVWEIYVHHSSWSSYMPDLLFQPFIQFPRNVNLVPHAWSSMLERLAVLPLLPLIAQLFLRRTEV